MAEKSGHSGPGQAAVAVPAAVLQAQERLRFLYEAAGKLFDAQALSGGDGVALGNEEFINLLRHDAYDPLSKPHHDLVTLCQKDSFGSYFMRHRVEEIYIRGELEKEGRRCCLSELFVEPMEPESTKPTLVVSCADSWRPYVFLQAVPFLWSVRKLWPQFQFVVALEMHRAPVQKADSVEALIFLGLSDVPTMTTRDIAQVQVYVRGNPQSVLIILDGVHDCLPAAASGLSSFMSNLTSIDTTGVTARAEGTCGVRVLVTSDPCAEIGKCIVSHAYEVTLELCGLTRANMEEYIAKELSCTKEKTEFRWVDDDAVDHENVDVALSAERAEDLRKWMSAGDDGVGGLMSMPEIGSTVLENAGRRPKAPAPRCVTHILMHHANTLDELMVGWRKYSDVQDIVAEMGQLSLDIMLNKKTAIFTTELEKFSREILISGMLRSLAVIHLAHHDYFQPLDKATPEFFAALYLVRYKLVDTASIRNLVAYLGTKSPHLYSFWVHVCALLDHTKACSLVMAMVRNRSADGNHQGYRVADKAIVRTDGAAPVDTDLDEDTSADSFRHDPGRDLLLLIAHCYYEHAMYHRCTEPVPTFPAVTMLFKHSDSFGLDLTTGASNPLDSARLSLPDVRAVSLLLRYHLRSVDMLDMRSWGMDDTAMRMLLPGLQSSPYTSCLLLDDNDIHEADTFRSLLSKFSDIRLLHLSEARIGDAGLSEVAEVLATCQRLHKLHLRDVCMTEKSLPALAKILADHDTLYLLDISGVSNDFSRAQASEEQAFVDTIREKSQIQALFLPPLTSNVTPSLKELLQELEDDASHSLVDVRIPH